MAKLDEIETELHKDQEAGFTPLAAQAWTNANGALLVQGLRELWAVHKEWYSQRPELLERDLSPEVVELFKVHPDALS